VLCRGRRPPSRAIWQSHHAANDRRDYALAESDAGLRPIFFSGFRAAGGAGLAETAIVSSSAFLMMMNFPRKVTYQEVLKNKNKINRNRGD
jgi:hypothetical protein